MVSTCSTVTSALSAACASFLIRSDPVRAGFPPLSAMTVIMTTRLEPQERTGRLTCVQRRQCQANPWPPTNSDVEPEVSDYTAGYADGRSDSADVSLRTD